MKNLFLLLIFLLGGLNLANGAKSKTFKVMAQPKEASIFVNNQFVGYGFANSTGPKRKRMLSQFESSARDINLSKQKYMLTMFGVRFLTRYKMTVFIEQLQLRV